MSPRTAALALVLLCLPGAHLFFAPGRWPTPIRARCSSTPACVEEAAEAPEAPVAAEAPEEKLLTCSKCKASYMIDVRAFGAGRQVRCSVCEHEWFQTAERLRDLRGDMELVPYPKDMKATLGTYPDPTPAALPRRAPSPRRTAQPVRRVRHRHVPHLRRQPAILGD